MGRPSTYSGGYPSVTEVISILNKPFLVPWAAKVTAERIKSCLTDTSRSWTLDEAVLEGKAEPNKVRDNAGDIGKDVHKMVEMYLSNQEIEQSEIRRLDIFLKFKEYIDSQKIKPALQEEPIYDDVNGFAGTPDLICTAEGRKSLEIRDWKIKTQIDKHELGLQLGGYSLLCKAKFGKLAKRAEGFCVSRDGIAKKPYVYTTKDMRKYETKFLNLLQVWRDKNG